MDNKKKSKKEELAKILRANLIRRKSKPKKDTNNNAKESQIKKT
jgi:hypothetical protein